MVAIEERTSNMIRNYAEFNSFDELDLEIAQVKGGLPPQARGTPSRQSGGHLSLGENASHRFSIIVQNNV